MLIPLGAYLLDLTNWRITWVALGLIILVLAVPLAFKFVRNDPAEMGLQPDGAWDSKNSPSKKSRRGPFEVEHWRQSFRSPPMWQLSAAYTVCGVTTGIISTHFVPFAEDKGASPMMAATTH